MQFTNPKYRSFWLEEIAGDAPDAPLLSDSTRTDIAIVGGGYVGLWTAIRIKQMELDCDVVVLEQDICGGGASGRNGGMVLSQYGFVYNLKLLSKKFALFARFNILMPTSGGEVGCGLPQKRDRTERYWR